MTGMASTIETDQGRSPIPPENLTALKAYLEARRASSTPQHETTMSSQQALMKARQLYSVINLNVPKNANNAYVQQAAKDWPPVTRDNAVLGIVAHALGDESKAKEIYKSINEYRLPAYSLADAIYLKIHGGLGPSTIKYYYYMDTSPTARARRDPIMATIGTLAAVGLLAHLVGDWREPDRIEKMLYGINYERVSINKTDHMEPEVRDLALEGLFFGARGRFNMTKLMFDEQSRRTNGKVVFSSPPHGREDAFDIAVAAAFETEQNGTRPIKSSAERHDPISRRFLEVDWLANGNRLEGVSGGYVRLEPIVGMALYYVYLSAYLAALERSNKD